MHNFVIYSKINDLKVPVPPVEEQRRIAAWLDERCGRIDGIVEALELKADALRRLRAALIEECVTGARTVPGE